MPESKAKELAKLASLAPTKGRLLVGDGNDWQDVGVGSNDQVLTADSTQAEGVKWAAPVGLGINQTWQDMSASRAISTSDVSPGSVYQNTTGAPIMVSVSDTTNESSMHAFVGTANPPTVQVCDWLHFSSNANQDNSVSNVMFVVPDNHYYFVSGPNVTELMWAELR